MKPPALHALTSLRFFAAAAIVWFHMQGQLLPLTPRPQLALGVSFFFVLSGFILAYSYRDMRTSSAKEFYIARFARIWPLHAVTMMFGGLVRMDSASQPGDLLAAVLNATLLQSWLPFRGLPTSYNAVAWSISVEMAFYLVFPLLATTKRFGTWLAVLAAVAGGTIIVASLLPTSARPQIWEFWPPYLVVFGPATRMFEFALGVGAGRLFISGRAPRLGSTSWEIGFLLLITGYALTSLSVAAYLSQVVSKPFGDWYSLCAGGALFAAAIYIFGEGRGAVSRALSARPLVFLGTISFSMYMVHDLIIKVMAKTSMISTVGVAGTATVTISLVVVASYLAWRFVEMPCQQIIRSIAPRSDGRRVLVVPSDEVKSPAQSL